MAVTLGQLIRERRMELNLTQEELAERVGEGVRQSEISRLERNRVALPRRHRMEALAVALEIPVGVLLARSGWSGAEEIDWDHADPDTAGNQDVDLAPVNHEDEPDGELALEPHIQQTSSGTALPPNDDSPLVNPAIMQADDDETGETWSEQDSQSLRDTVTRTELMITQSRSRLHDVKSTIRQGRRSLDQDSETGPL